MSDVIVPPQETSLVEEREGPPDPPKITPRVDLPRVLRIGLPMMMLPTLLALFGVFDEHEAIDTAQAGALSIRVASPDRLRENRHGTVHIELENRGDVPIAAEVAISPEYVAEFVLVSMTPPGERAWAARIADIPPGARRAVLLEFEAEAAGPHRGVVRVRTERGEEARVELATFVFP